MKDFKVNLFIVGAAKCGTTYLAEYLNKHSEVNMASMKEPDYFSHELLNKKVDYYNTKPVKSLVAYKALFKTDRPYTYYGEASVSYLPYKQVAQNIYDYNPEARIIILMRDPTNRAFSHYKMDKRLGLISYPFAKVVSRQSTSKWQNQHYYQYIELGFYYEQVAAYLTLFGTKQVYCITDSTELDSELPGILHFLGLPYEHIKLSRANEAISFDNPIFRRLYASPSIRKILKKIIPSSLLNGLKKNEEILNLQLRKQLDALYHKDQQKLKTLLNHE